TTSISTLCLIIITIPLHSFRPLMARCQKCPRPKKPSPNRSHYRYLTPRFPTTATLLSFPCRDKFQSRSPILLLWLPPRRDEAKRRRCTAHGEVLFA
ncbi:hypothetical protein BGX38DRAFT_1222091, partial [Terfezia claveryi]